MVNYLALNGNIRSELGTANTNRLRKEGYIPAVIYGSNNNDNIFLSILKKDFDKEYLKGNIQIRPIELTIDNKTYKVLPYQIDIDPVTDLPRHVDFINIEGKEQVKVYIPVNFIGADKSPGVKKGGFLNILKRKIQFYTNPLSIPTHVDVNVSAMHIGTKIKINDVKFPDGIKPVDKVNFTICSVTGRGKSDIAKPTTDETADTTSTDPKTENKEEEKK